MYQNFRSLELTRFVIIGGSGYIGAKLSKNLISYGKVIIVDHRTYNDLNVEQFQFDELLVNDQLQRYLFTSETTVINLRWYSNPADYLNSNKNMVSLQNFMMLSLMAYKMNVKKYVGIGSCAEYSVDGTEKRGLSTELKSDTLYGSTKIIAYLLSKKIYEEKSGNFCWLRLFYVYEHGLRNDKIHGIIERSVENNNPIEIKRPKDILDFIHVRDAILLISKHVRGSSSGAHNVCTGSGQKISTLAQTYAKRLGFSGEIVCSEQTSKPLKIIGDL